MNAGIRGPTTPRCSSPIPSFPKSGIPFRRPHKDTGHFLDPACGSGIFLVRSFQRLCAHWRETRISETIPWSSLLAILSRLNGWDLNGNSVRVAVFSLYVALLEEVSPPNIRIPAERGRFLPELWGKMLRTQDFFTDRAEGKFDVVIGNPPWKSRKGTRDRPSVEWCGQQGLPMPGKEDAWAFTWKSLRHVGENGIVAFLLPAMGFLHNHTDESVKARERLLTEARIDRMINFSDLRFQLFEGANRSAALLIFGPGDSESPPYRFDYWAPKADLNLKLKRLIMLSSLDKGSITSSMAIADPFVFKRRLWMNAPDAKLFNYLSRFPKLGAIITKYGRLKRRKQQAEPNVWIISQGFQPANKADKDSKLVATTPYLPIQKLTILAQATHGLSPWKSGDVRRRGFEAGFSGPRILIPQGISTAKMRLQASYTEKPFTFQDSIQAITVPSGQERRARLLTALLNSRVATWFAFHGTGSFGSERPKVHEAELAYLPFPSPEDTPNPEQSRHAAAALVAIVDKALEALDQPFELQSGNDDEVLAAIDRHAYEYFCLSDDEIILISDTVDRIIPAVQPRKGTFPEIWEPAEPGDRTAYATTLIRALTDWFEGNSAIDARLEARNQDLAILRLTLGESKGEGTYSEEENPTVGEALSRLSRHLRQPLPGNFQLMPDFRAFVGEHLYLVKPMQKRFWLKATALADADAIALDLQDSIELREQQDPA